MSLVFVFGLLIGSFLNVVIYRGSAKYLGSNYKGPLTIKEPKGSFCPQCLSPLKWYENIPLLSYLIQAGKCRHCKCSIPFQYPAVEAANAGLWVLCYHQSNTLAEFFVGILTISLLISAMGIDLKTLKIPNGITLGGTIAILVIGSLLVTGSLKFRAEGIIVGFATTFLIIQLGKLLFGRKKVVMKTPTPFVWKQVGRTLTIQEEGKSLKESEEMKQEDLFVRNSDFIEIWGEIKINKGKTSEERLKITKNRTYLLSPPDKVEVGENEEIEGKIKTIIFPTEAMGMGDAKLMALIGACLGAVTTLQVLVIAACAGALFGIGLRLVKALKKQNPPNTIAFGPWLAAAAVYALLYMP